MSTYRVVFHNEKKQELVIEDVVTVRVGNGQYSFLGKSASDVLAITPVEKVLYVEKIKG